MGKPGANGSVSLLGFWCLLVLDDLVETIRNVMLLSFFFCMVFYVALAVRFVMGCLLCLWFW